MALPGGFDGLEITLDEALRGRLALGVLEVCELRHDRLGSAFDAERDRVIGRLTALHAGRASGDMPGTAEARSLFHALGIDPTKTRPSSEALLRRVLQGKGLPVVSPIVDVCNLCSLEHQLPLGLYDRDRLNGPVRARVGAAEDGYDGIRKARVNLGGRPMLADAEGPFGAPISDSLRTSVTDRSTAVVVVVFCPIARAGEDLLTGLGGLSERLATHCGGKVMAVRVLR